MGVFIGLELQFLLKISLWLTYIKLLRLERSQVERPSELIDFAGGRS